MRGVATAWRCYASTSTSSRRSTTRWVIRSATRCCRPCAERLAGQSRDTDTVARLGGDEFAIVQTRIEKPAEATAFAARLIELFEAPFEVAGHQIVIGTSIGIAFAPQDGMDADQLLTQRRPRPVSREVGRPRRLSAVPRRDGCTDAGAAPAGARSAPGAAMPDSSKCSISR